MSITEVSTSPLALRVTGGLPNYDGSLPGTSERAAEPGGRYNERGLRSRLGTACPLQPVGTEAGHPSVSAVSVSDGLTRPTIGDVLLSHGFVDAETLAGAAAEQERTGQPVGQILVERGAITRLELASALAEQWAEAPAPGRSLPEPGGSPPLAPRAPNAPTSRELGDKSTDGVRVQSAVSDLTRRVNAVEPLLAEVERQVSEAVSPEELEASLVEVRRQVGASLEGVSTRLDQVTDGLEEAFGEMQAGAAELAERLATATAGAAAAATGEDVETLRQVMEARLGELVASHEVEAQQLAEARATLAILAERPVVSPEVEDRVRELAVRVDGVASADDLARLRAAFDDLDVRLEGAADGEALAAVRQDLAELVARLDAQPELAARLDELDARLGEAAKAAGPDRATTERLECVEALVTDLAGRVESLGAVAASGTDADAIEELRSALEELGRRRHGDEETVARLEALGAVVEELASRPGADLALAGRVDALAQALEGVTADTTAAELRMAVDALTERSGVGESALQQLAGQVEELSAGLAASQADELTASLRTEVEEIRERLEADDASLVELRAAATELAARPAGDPELAARLTLLAARVDEVAAETADAAAVARDGSALDQLGESVSLARNELTADLEAVAERIAALEGAFQPQVEVAVGPADLVALREELTRDLSEGLALLTAEAPAEDPPWAEEVARLGEQLELLSTLVGNGLAAALDGAEAPARRAPVPSDPESDTERELERLRMAIERMSMHLGEQERALAEVMRSRGVAQRLDELEARIDDFEAGAGTGGDGGSAPGGAAPAGSSADARALGRRLDGAEAALEAEREKMLTKLDRMASAIDWRLQRLEAANPE